tara:strand:+ start:464 stop:874 length:411 start_codon:yes stop_codon:yes gene_type:complete
MPALLGIGGWIARALLGSSVAGILRGIAGLIIRQLGIKAALLAMWGVAWATIVSFAAEVFQWFIETSFSVLEFAMIQLEFPDIFLMIMQAIDGLPAASVEFLVVLGVFKWFEFLLSCVFANRALRQIPIIGNAFGG